MSTTPLQAANLNRFARAEKKENIHGQQKQKYCATGFQLNVGWPNWMDMFQN